MDKYEKLYKGLDMCSGPDCNPECPYHGETRGGKTCRAWLLNDALVALLDMETRADEAENERDDLRGEVAALAEALEEAGIECDDRPVRSKKTAPGLAESMEIALKSTMQAEYWRGQAEALKEFMRFSWGADAVEDDVDTEPPEAEADSYD